MGAIIAMRTFLRDNWYSIVGTIVAVVGGIFVLGVHAQKLNQLHDRVGEVKATQTQKITEFEQVKDDMERIKWEASNTRSDIDQIKLDVRSIDKNVQQIDKRQEVIIELLKPRAN